MNVERLLVYINRVVRYVTICVLSYGCGVDTSWLEHTLEFGRVPASENCGNLMIVTNHEKDLISLLETLKDTTELQ